MRPPSPKIFVTICHKKDQYPPHPLAVTYFLKHPIPTRILKEFSELFADFLYQNFKTCLDSENFTEILKSTEVVPIYKKTDNTDQNNYRPVSILSSVSKIYERRIQEQMNYHFANLPSKF